MEVLFLACTVSFLTVLALSCNLTTMKSKGKGKATSQGNDSTPFGIIFRDEVYKSRYDTLIKHKIVYTCYLDEHALNILGIKDDVYWMLDIVGWVPFM